MKCMGKKFRRNFKTSRFKATVNVAISRLAILKNQRQSRCSFARSDVVQLLNLGHHERALLRVEQVIRENNMLDVFVMIEGYCLLLIERLNLIEQESVCPDELKEAISSLIHAATRCGDFPELQKIRSIFTSHFGKEFATRAIELRNNCGVNPKMIQMLSTRMPSLENRLKMLKEIASENKIVLQIEEVSSVTTELMENSGAEQKQDQPKSDPPARSSSATLLDNLPKFPDQIARDGYFSYSMESQKKYRDAADAALDAFESATYAAAAARAAVELSRSESRDPDNHPSPNPRQRKVTGIYQCTKSTRKTDKEDKGLNVGLGFEKIHPIQKYFSKSEDEGIQNEIELEKIEQNKRGVEFKRSVSSASSDSADNILKGAKLPSELKNESKTFGRTIVFYKSDDNTEKERHRIPLSRTHDSDFGIKHTSGIQVLSSENSNTIRHEFSEGSTAKLQATFHKHFTSRSRAGEEESGPGNPQLHVVGGSMLCNAQHLNAENRPVSVRTRHTYNW